MARLFQNGVLKIDEPGNIRRRLIMKQTEMLLKKLNAGDQHVNMMRELIELYFLKKIKYIQERNPHEQVPKRTNKGNFRHMKKLVMEVSGNDAERESKK